MSTLLFVGLNIDELMIGYRELPLFYAAFDMPAEAVLRCVRCVFVFDVHDARRLLQLQKLCQHMRKHGAIQTVFGCSRKRDTNMAAQVRANGAEFILL